jgi:hypothetical protein
MTTCNYGDSWHICHCFKHICVVMSYIKKDAIHLQIQQNWMQIWNRKGPTCLVFGPKVEKFAQTW